MQPPKHAPRPGPGNDASAVFHRLAEGASLRSLDDPQNGPVPDADVVLAAILDLNGTVRLADHLAIRKPQLGASGRHAPPSPVRDRLAKKVDEIVDEARSAFDAPFVGRRAMPSRELILRILEQTKARETRDEAAIVAAAGLLHAQVRERFDHHLARARQRIRWLRTDVSAELRALGPRAADLEAFDAVLTRGIDPGFIRLLQALETRLDAVFTARLRASVLALPPPPDDRAIASWFEGRGCMARHARDLSALLCLIVDHEIDALHSLADAAWALRTEEATS